MTADDATGGGAGSGGQPWSARYRLTSIYHRRDDADADSDWFGTFDVTLSPADAATAATFDSELRLAMWAPCLLTPGPDSNARVVDRVAGRVVLEPVDGGRIVADGSWHVGGLRSRIPARHANDGPTAAYVVAGDGMVDEVDVEPATASQPPRPRSRTIEPPHDRSVVSVVPHPRHVDAGPTRASTLPTPFVLASPALAADWDAVARLARRCVVDVLHPAGQPPAEGTRCSVDVDDGLDPTAHRIEFDRDSVRLTGGSHTAVRHGLVTLAQLAAAGTAPARIDDQPRFEFRGVHLDLARRWFEPEVVERLIDLAAWRKLSHVHLHLTDDEAWRLPVDGYPTLGHVGGTRGHGLPIPPVCGSGPAPYGRAYTADEIGRWVQRGDELGVVLVPEVDVPAHCGAALAAVPSLRDPDDTSQAVSAQAYVDNVLVPGHPETEPFLRAVFASVAELFPSSPVIHIGGDEVPHGAWQGSPIAQRQAERRGLGSVAELEAEFHHDLVAMITTTTGRDVAMWEEAAFRGVDVTGYAVGWTSPEAGRRLAAAGHRVVVAPGQAYYLDMAPDRAWESPGNAWAGTVTLDDTCAFDPVAGWPPELADRIHGVQACIWGEHVSSLEVLDRLAFPRLDAVAERAWTGEITGGADDLAARAAPLPRFHP